MKDHQRNNASWLPVAGLAVKASRERLLEAVMMGVVILLAVVATNVLV